MLALAILAATRMAPRFANEDGELLFDFLVAEFPDLATSSQKVTQENTLTA